MTTTTETIARRQTFDGVTVYLHSDGSISTRDRVLPVAFRLPVATMHRVFDDVCVWTIEELHTLAMLAREGRHPRKTGSGCMDPGILERQRIEITHNRRVSANPLWRKR
jgi:hypothetical protein